MNGQFLIPANTKRGKLIISIFRPVDIAIFLIGVAVTFILLIILSNMEASSWVKVVAVLPGLIATVLVVPIPNYHNVMVCIGELISFYTNNRNYKWRGWCATYESKREQQLAKAKASSRSR